MLVYYDPTLSSKITKGLYPQIAEKYTSNESRVERSMRHAIEVSWNRGNWDMMEDIFVAILCVFALGVGVWTWWYENYGPGEITEKEEDEETKAENN